MENILILAINELLKTTGKTLEREKQWNWISPSGHFSWAWYVNFSKITKHKKNIVNAFCFSF